MPRTRPINSPRAQRGRPISLGGSGLVGGQWSDDRLHEEKRERSLRLVPLNDRSSGWHLAALDGEREVGRLAHVGSGARAWIWAVKHGASGYAASRAQALGELARNLAGSARSL